MKTFACFNFQIVIVKFSKINLIYLLINTNLAMVYLFFFKFVCIFSLKIKRNSMPNIIIISLLLNKKNFL